MFQSKSGNWKGKLRYRQDPWCFIIRSSSCNQLPVDQSCRDGRWQLLITSDLMLCTLPALLSLPMRFGNVDTCMTQLTNRAHCWDEAPWSLSCLRCGRNSLCREVRREGKGNLSVFKSAWQKGWSIPGGSGVDGQHTGSWRGARENQESSPGSIVPMAAKQPVPSYSRQIQGTPGVAAEGSDGSELKRPGWHFLEGWDG